MLPSQAGTSVTPARNNYQEHVSHASLSNGSIEAANKSVSYLRNESNDEVLVGDALDGRNCQYDTAMDETDGNESAIFEEGKSATDITAFSSEGLQREQGSGLDGHLAGSIVSLHLPEVISSPTVGRFHQSKVTALDASNSRSHVSVRAAVMC